ncbi:Transcriptional activator of fatty acid utilization [Sporothrix eucalyptigena]|uniref:Transcriptional activator of fatty acid utilization n=1 Tax=Sporothrix eucalyptigena TaxID=1812306 RepID=A0ABP0BY52_9PEZI
MDNAPESPPRPKTQRSDLQTVKKRTRASVACNNCRVKRSKCDGATVGTPCSQCSKYGLHCELRQDRKRQRPSGAVLVEDLTERVQLLERLLNIKNKQAAGEMRSRDAEDTRGDHESDDQSVTQSLPVNIGTVQTETYDTNTKATAALAFHSSEDSDPDFSFAEASFLDQLGDGTNLDGFDLIPPPAEDDLFNWEGLETIENIYEPRRQDVMGPPLSRPAHIPGTQETLPDKQMKRRKPSDAHAPTVPAAVPSTPKAVRTPSLSSNINFLPSSAGNSPVSPSTVPDTLVDELLDLYFTQFQTMLKIVDQPTFQQARTADTCRESLVLAMMAAGARFSTDSLLETQYRVRSSGETVFARRSKQLLESEVGHADIATVQALLILGELETSAGNDMSGCMYSGLVSRLIFDLRLDPASSQEVALSLSEADRSVRHWILWYASVQDKYWAQRLCRPLTIKNMELQLSRMIAKFAQQSSRDETGESTSPETVIQECVLDLLELTREALEFLVGGSPSSTGFRASVESYATVSRINGKLDQWFRNLPGLVKDNPGNSNKTNHFVPVLHMQYHFTKIQLFSPFALFQTRLPSSPSSVPSTPSSSPAMAHITDRCRQMGAASAVCIAKLFATFRRTYDIRCLQCSGVQYAETAAQFLVKYIPLLMPDEVVEPEAHLRSLARTLEVMQETFRPAKKPLDDVTEALQALEEREMRERERTDTHKGKSACLQSSGVSPLPTSDMATFLYV